MSPSAIKRLTVNRSEELAHHLIGKAVQRNGDQISLKSRLADVIDVEMITGNSGPDLTYAMKAHLDFVIADEKSLPRFAIEIDGSSHWANDRARSNDERKDRLCEQAGLPLIRVGSDFARKEGRWTVLEYLISNFYTWQASEAAQERGELPDDFFFSPFLMLRPEIKPGEYLFDTLDADARTLITRLWRAGTLPTPVVEWHSFNVPERRSVKTYAFIPAAPDRYLVGASEIRASGFCGITNSELGEQLAIAEIGSLATQWANGKAVAMNTKHASKALDEVRQAAIEDRCLTTVPTDAHELKLRGAQREQPPHTPQTER
ncbi:DUF2726 domain-containing protein [Streptomyces spororaveus]|uniref:DUF2726 domain-containing protein n=1 Tax=Streptomyces spororaveus TaxID=284039 RepID=UPI0037B309A8